jgi:hypothetical protein
MKNFVRKKMLVLFPTPLTELIPLPGSPRHLDLIKPMSAVNGSSGKFERRASRTSDNRVGAKKPKPQRLLFVAARRAPSVSRRMSHAVSFF